jgi:hypothetical protein
VFVGTVIPIEFPDSTHTIYYTTDGSNPTTLSPVIGVEGFIVTPDVPFTFLKYLFIK